MYMQDEYMYMYITLCTIHTVHVVYMYISLKHPKSGKPEKLYKLKITLESFLTKAKSNKNKQKR